jgi:hypothetical protein
MIVYKRIITIDPAHANDLRSHAMFGVKVRPCRTGRPDEWVIETSDIHERRAVDNVAKLFDATA